MQYRDGEGIGALTASSTNMRIGAAVLPGIECELSTLRISYAAYQERENRGLSGHLKPEYTSGDDSNHAYSHSKTGPEDWRCLQLSDDTRDTCTVTTSHEVGVLLV